MLLELGALFGLSQWIVDVSPFTHVPKLPGAAFTATPLLWLAVIAVALAGPAWPGSAAATSADLTRRPSILDGRRAVCQPAASGYRAPMAAARRWRSSTIVRSCSLDSGDSTRVRGPVAVKS